MTKLVIQIPCYNEEEVLRTTLDELPKTVEGFDQVEIVVIDDGSMDATSQIAREYGGIHVVSLPCHMGLARAFTVGIETALRMGADVIVNTDADNQYCASSIPDLVRPILDGKAQVVIGARPVRTDRHMSLVKRILQVFGSWVVRQASGTNIADAPSGFRAIHRDAALRLFVYSNYTYTLETIIQAGRKNIPVVSVPVKVNPPTRPSRLVRSNVSYVLRSLTTICKRSFPSTLTPAIWRDVFEWESVRFDQAAVVLGKLKGSRSLMSASPARCGNSVRTWRNHANGSTPQARQVNIRL